MIARMAVGIRAWRERVAEAVGDGASLEEVDHELIEPAPLPAELRDALWLYAWGLTEREREETAAAN
jgi:hypothetical protein